MNERDGKISVVLPISDGDAWLLLRAVLTDALGVPIRPVLGWHDLYVHLEWVCCLEECGNQLVSLSLGFCLEVGQWLAVSLRNIEDGRWPKAHESFLPAIRRCLIVFTVTALVIRRRVSAVRTLLCDDGRPNPDRCLPFFHMSVKLVLPCSIAGNACCMRTLEFDQQRVSVRVVVEATLDVQPLCELLARDGVIDLIDEVLDPRFDRTVHLIVPGVRIVERFPGAAARSHV